MAKQVITVPRGATLFKMYPDQRENNGPHPGTGELCMNCNRGWGAHHGHLCPTYEKIITIKPVKSVCVKFQPEVEKELLRLGIKHALLAEMKHQGALDTRLELILKDKSTGLVIKRAFLWQNAKDPLNGNTGFRHWQSLATKCRN